MNSRQRRGVILLLLSVICALGAFAGVLSVISDVKSKVGPEVTAYQVKDNVAPYTALTAAQFKKIEMPKRWLSDNAVTDLRQISGKIAVTTLRAGSLLQTDMIVDQPALQPGQQEVAIMIDAATGVAGKITPGSTVNVYATFEGAKEGDPDQSKIIVTNAKVIDVGHITALDPAATATRTSSRPPTAYRSPSR
jgi:pilus assembly protein CpaB